MKQTKKSDDCIKFQRGGVLETEKDIKMDEGSHQSTPDVDTTKEDRADMLAEFEEYAENKRYMRCLKLACGVERMGSRNGTRP